MALPAELAGYIIALGRAHRAPDAKSELIIRIWHQSSTSNG